METQKVIDDLVAFRNERGWQDFHNLESLSRALGIEASEVEKVFLWKNNDSELSDKDRDDLKFELADVLTYAYYMCEKLGVDPNEVVEEKLAKNKARHWKFEEK
ncbi:nucleotide pyrophosphohydrolase [Lacticaseibacillus sp. N501-2]|uniref:nucleotide pyrophosphohydrolase n=1 Tax=Lacticaseibacillus salsurae TaxID=3367729 RepID=UPI0038B278ED